MRIALLIPSLTGGGTERAKLRLASGLIGLGHEVDIVVATRRSAVLAPEMPPDARYIALGAPRTLGALPGLCRYLRRARPDIMISSLHEANNIAALAKLVTRSRARLLITLHNNTSATLALQSDRRTRWAIRAAGYLHRLADSVGAVSDGVARDAERVWRLPAGAIKTLPNPLDSDTVRALADCPLDHPWFAQGMPPVILSCGRLVPDKGFDTLIAAFAKTRQAHAARLVILGAGPLRATLLRQAAASRVADDVQVLDFDQNPFRYMRRAAVFALASRLEGYPNALIEALACGCRVVATDCPSGPREILSDNACGLLVPVDDVDALAAALAKALTASDWTVHAEPLLQKHAPQRAARAHLDVLGLPALSANP